MDSNEALSTIAEVSIALPSSSGVVVGLRRIQAGDWKHQDLAAALLVTASGLVEFRGSLLSVSLMWLLLVAFAQFVMFIALTWSSEN